MDTLLENKIILSQNVDSTQWVLQEFTKLGEKIGDDQRPWVYSLWFTARELNHITNYSGDDSISDYIDNNHAHDEYINGTLRSGVISFDGELEDEISYSMFGSNIKIDTFDLFIRKQKENYAGDFCTINSDFTDNSILIELSLPEDKFNTLSSLIKARSIDRLQVCLSCVSGFYSTPSCYDIFTNNIKILTNSEDQQVITPDKCKINPPRLGKVDNSSSITIFQKYKLATQQNELSDYPDHGKKEVRLFLLEEIARNRVALKNIQIVAWCIFGVLILILMSTFL